MMKIKVRRSAKQLLATTGAALVMCAAMPATSAMAATITVTTGADELNADGDCSLREAIQAANTNAAVDACEAGAGDDEIVLGAGTYQLTIAGAGNDDNAAGDLDISENLTIRGAGAQQTTLDAGGDASVGRLLDVAASARVTVRGVTLRGGAIDGASGGAVRNLGDLTLADVVVTQSRARAGFGGGIYNEGTLTLQDAVLSQNEARGGDGAPTPTGGRGGSGGGGGGMGGGLFNASTGSVSMSGVTIAGNTAVGGSGGAVLCGSATNTSGGSGGGPNGAAGTGTSALQLGGGGAGGSSSLAIGRDGGTGAYGGGGGGGGASSSGGTGGTGGAGGTGAGGGSTATFSCPGGGGGGAGMGAGVFNDGGTLSMSTVTLAANSAHGGRGASFYGSATPGQGLGAGVFLRGGTLDALCVAFSGNRADQDGDQSLDGGVVNDQGCNTDAPLLTATVMLPAGDATCPTGGTILSVGRDDDGDGSLSSAEVDDAITLCRGANGANGANGTTGPAGPAGQDGEAPISTSAAIPAGDAACPNGGTRLSFGVDGDGDGALTGDEIATTADVCNGSAGAPQLVQTETLIVGDTNCAAGGLRVETGADADGDGALSADEITKTSYVCSGARGLQGQAGESACSATGSHRGAPAGGLLALLGFVMVGWRRRR